MAWYLYWLIFLAVAGGLFYGTFFVLPGVFQKRKQQQQLEAQAPEEVEADDDDPVKNCPVCTHEMKKVSLNGIIVDRCEIHGIWFDNGELETLVNFVRSGGNLDGFLSGLGVHH